MTQGGGGTAKNRFCKVTYLFYADLLPRAEPVYPPAVGGTPNLRPRSEDPRWDYAFEDRIYAINAYFCGLDLLKLPKILYVCRVLSSLVRFTSLLASGRQNRKSTFPFAVSLTVCEKPTEAYRKGDSSKTEKTCQRLQSPSGPAMNLT
jgi:hypothetical protein